MESFLFSLITAFSYLYRFASTHIPAELLSCEMGLVVRCERISRSRQEDAPTSYSSMNTGSPLASITVGGPVECLPVSEAEDESVPRNLV
jgi:hypothetical protein